MGFRDRRGRRRGERKGDSGAQRFQMRQKLFSIGDDYWIENDRDERVFKVNGKALRIRKTLIFEDANARSWRRFRSGWSGSRTPWKSRMPDAGGWRITMVKKEDHDEVAVVSKK